MVISGAPAWLSVGWIIAVIVLLLCILGLVGVLPETPIIIFGLLAGLAISRLL